VLRSQRNATLKSAIPPVARQALKRALSARLEESAEGALLDDWRLPLVAGRSLGLHHEPLPEGHAATTPPGPRVIDLDQPGGEARRCLLATSALDVGGMDEMVAFLARRLRAHGFLTAVLHTVAADASAEKGRLGQMLADAGIEVVVLDEAAGRRWMRAWGPEVISAHGAADWVLDEARSGSIPYVETLHGMHSLFDVDWTAEARRNQAVTAIVAVSELVRRQYLNGAPAYPADRIVTIPNGVDSDRRQRTSRLAARTALGLRDEFLFVSLARHCLQKNTFGLVAAFSELAAAHEDAHLLITGRVEDPFYFRQVRDLRDASPASRQIHLRDHASDPGLLLSAADAFVLDSFFEGWALASMEALHAGLPVVASDVGGAREQLGPDGERGFLVPNPLGDPLTMSWKRMGAASLAPQVNQRDLVTAMERVIGHRDHWAAKREQLAAESERRFHPDGCVRQHADLLGAVAAGARIRTAAAA
jgi:glycosyltransferase involved in cell wall biosynthesis